MTGLIAPEFVICKSFSQFEAFEDATQGWDLDFIQLGAGQGGYRLEQWAAGPLLFSRAWLGARFHQHGGSPSGYRTFSLLATGSTEFRWCNELIASDTMLVMPASGDFESMSSPGLDTFHLSLSSELLEWAAQQQLDCAFEQLLGPERTICRHAGTRVMQLRILLQQFSAGLASPGEGAVTSSFIRRLALLVVDVLAGSDHSAPRLSRGRRGRALSEALNYIGDCGDLGLSVRELVSETGVSRRTLESAFRDTLGTSPAAYLKSLRLHKLRAALLQSSPAEVSVARLGQACGFQHGGQMAADYFDLFGESPSITLRHQALATMPNLTL